MAEQSMLDFVPLARPRRRMADLDNAPHGIRQPWEVVLPQPIALAIPPPAVGGDQQPRRGGIALAAQLVPPLLNGGHCKLGRIMRDADRDPGLVVHEVIDPVGDRFSPLGIRKVVGVNCDWLPLGAIFSATVFLVAQRLFLLCVDRDRRAAAAPLRRHSAIEVRELRLALRMVFACPRLAIRLQAVAGLLEQLPDGRVADHEALLGECVRQVR